MIGQGGCDTVRDLDIARWRLHSQHLVSPPAGSAGAVVGSLLAVQAENFSQAGEYLHLEARLSLR